MKLSVVIPCYGSPESLRPLTNRLSATLSQLTGDSFEIILVNDACPKNSWNVIEQLTHEYANVVGVKLSRNFGQHAAIAAGLNIASGSYIVVMDCDLQDQPEEILKMYEVAEQGHDVVFGRRVERQDSLLKRFLSKVFYKFYDYLSGFDTDHSIANFSLVSKKVIDEYNKIPEKHRPYPYMINWLGFSRKDVDIMHSSRPEGKSSYTLSKLISFAIDNIICQTNKPLKLSINIGFLMSSLSFFYALYLVLQYVIKDYVTPGWTSVMVAIFFVGGLLMANLGLLGLYIGKIFDGIKDRPIFIIDKVKVSNLSDKNTDFQ